MIISPARNFVFVHSRKVAGTSISVALSRDLSANDRVVGNWPEIIDSGGQPNKFVQEALDHFAISKNLHLFKNLLRGRGLVLKPTFINLIVKKYCKALTSCFDIEQGAHQTAYVTREMDPETWENGFKFCFVRNPWEHAVSDFNWRRQRKISRNVTFKEFLIRLKNPSLPDKERIRPPVLTNWPLYTIDDKVVVDFIGRFETLKNDIQIVQKQLGFDLELGMTAFKRGKDTAMMLRSYYDDECINLVEQIYQNEIREFNYSLPF